MIFPKNNGAVIQENRSSRVSNRNARRSHSRIQSSIKHGVGVKLILPSANHRQSQKFNRGHVSEAATQNLSVEDGRQSAQSTGTPGDERASTVVAKGVGNNKSVCGQNFHPVRTGHQFGGGAYEVGGCARNGGCNWLSEEDSLTADQTVIQHGKQCGTGCYQRTGVRSNQTSSGRVVDGARNPVKDVGLGSILQSTGQVQCVYTGICARDVFNQVGGLSVDCNREIPVRISVAYNGSVTSRSGDNHRSVDTSGNEVGATGKYYSVVDVTSVHRVGSQQNIVLRVL